MVEVPFGNPWLFSNIINVLKDGKEEYTPSNEERLEIIKKHIELEVLKKGEDVGIKEMRKHLAWYTKGLKESSAIRQKINMIDKKDELIMCLDEYFKSL